MIIPCIDFQGGKVVQLIQGREKALEGEAPLTMLEKFAAFGVIQVIDLDAAMNRGENNAMVEDLAGRAKTRVGGGVRTVERAQELIEAGASRVIVGTAAYKGDGINAEFLEALDAAVGKEQVLLSLDSKGGKITVQGWQQAVDLTAEEVVGRLEPYCGGFLCTYVDKEGMLEGTDLGWYRRLRSATEHELTAAGGITTLDEIRELDGLGIHAALGMAIYTGRLDLGELADLNKGLATGI